jgi:hypothetical protein
VVVEGTNTGDWYIPYQGKERELANVEPLINSPTALFPGTYTVKVYLKGMEKSLGEAEVKAGRTTVLKQ